jgi:ribose transport system ATP-binding protein
MDLSRYARPWLDHRGERAALQQAVADFGIRTGSLDIRASSLSGGNQQKIAIARLLHHDVDVFILDEPTRGIDVGSKAQIYRFIDGLVADREGRPARSVLMVSSYLPELLGMCDRIAVMRRGRLETPRPAAGLTEHDLMMQATGAMTA